MMPPIGQVTVLLTLMRELEEVMRAEAGILREMRLDRLTALQDEKSALAEAYELELRRLRTAPETVGGLEPEARAALEEAMRRFQAAVHANGRQIEAARKVVEGIVRALATDAAGAEVGRLYGAGTGRPAGRVVSLALNRQI